MLYQLLFKSDTPLSDEEFEGAMRTAIGVKIGKIVSARRVNFTPVRAQSLDGIRPETYTPPTRDILD